MLSALSVTGGLPLEHTVGNAQEVIFTGREELNVGAHGEFSGVAQVLFGGKSGAGVNGQRIAGSIFDARDKPGILAAAFPGPVVHVHIRAGIERIDAESRSAVGKIWPYSPTTA